MNSCRWCAATTVGLCYKHLEMRLERDAAVRRWVRATVTLVLTIAACWVAYRWARW
jgi:hypothetical protein